MQTLNLRFRSCWSRPSFSGQTLMKSSKVIQKAPSSASTNLTCLATSGCSFHNLLLCRTKLPCFSYAELLTCEDVCHSLRKFQRRKTVSQSTSVNCFRSSSWGFHERTIPPFVFVCVCVCVCEDVHVHVDVDVHMNADMHFEMLKSVCMQAISFLARPVFFDAATFVPRFDAGSNLLQTTTSSRR
jgi:hypothetical protein